MKEIFGFDDIKSEIIKNFNDNKLHHCNLINGTRGIGKSEFVHDVASIILSEKNNVDRKNIGISELSKTCKLIESGGHTDLFILNIDTLDIDGKENTSKKGEINVNQVRKIVESLKLSPSISNNKVLIVDSVDNVNVNGQNTLLKTLEEPPSNTYIFLICHNINKVINTIQSRSNIFNIPNLNLENWVKALFGNTEMQEKELTDDEIQNLYNLSNYSVGFALEIVKSNATDLYDKVLDLITNGNITKIQEFSGTIDSQELFELFSNFLDKIFQNLIEFSSLYVDGTFSEKKEKIFINILKNVGIKKIIESYEYSKKMIYDINTYNLDKRHCVGVLLYDLSKILVF
jgi:DNA polymerase-3 subunit delta'